MSAGQDMDKRLRAVEFDSQTAGCLAIVALTWLIVLTLVVLHFLGGWAAFWAALRG